MARAGSVALASAFVLTFGAAGCGSATAPKPDAASATTPTPALDPDPARAQPSAAAPAPSATALDTAGLRARLLTVADLPSGFAPDPEDADADGRISSRDQRCGPMVELMNSDGKPAGAVADADASFTRSELGPNVATGLASFPSVPAAQGLLDMVTAAMRGCTELTETDKDGSSYDFAVAPLTFPTVGDAGGATRMAADIGGYPAQIDIVLARVGSTLLYVANTGLGGTDSELTRQVVSRAVAKLRDPAEPVLGS